MRMAEKLNNLDANQVNAIVSSIDPNEINKFVVRGDKIKIRLDSGRKIKLKGVDTKAFQERSNQKVSKDINIQQIVTVLRDQGVQKTPEQVLQNQEVSAMKKLLEQYRQLLEKYKKEIDDLKAGINTSANTPVNNSITGNSQEYNRATGFIDNAFPSPINSVDNTATSVGKSSNRVKNGDGNSSSSIDGGTNIIEYGATDSIPMSPNESKNSVSNKKEKMPDDAVAYNYQSIYELDQSDLKNLDKMSNRDIIRVLFKGKYDSFVDIIETNGKENKTTAPSSEEKNLLREYFKRPMNRLVEKRGVDPLEIWEEMEKVVKNNPSALTGNYESDKEFWMKNEIFSDKTKKTSALNRLFKDDKTMIAENLAKLSSLYIKVQGNKGQYAYTNRLFAMMDRAGGVDYQFAAGGLKNIINANRDNVGQVKLSDGAEILDTKRDLSKARKLLVDMAGGDIPPYLSDSALTESSLKNVLNQSVKGKMKPSTDGLRTLLNNFKGLTETFDTLSANTPTSGHMNARLMLTEGKAYGATDAEIYNIKAVAEKAVLSTKYGSISDATRLMNFFADYNNNGKGGDAADFGGFSGAQLLWNYRMAVNKLQFNNGGMDKTAAETKIVSGILNKIQANALQGGDLYVANVIEAYLKNKPSDMMSLVKEHPAMVKYIQKYLKSFSGDNLYALMFVDDKKSMRTFYKEVETTSQNSVQSLATQLEGIKDPAERAKVLQAIKDRALVLQSEINAQSATLSPDERKYFNSFDLASLEQNVAHTVFRAIQVNPSLNGALGAGVAVDLAKNIQLNLSAATGKNGVTVPSLGLGFKSDSGVFGSNVNVTHLGANAAAFVRFGERSNTSKLSNTLKPLSYKTTSLTGNVSGGAGFDRVPHVGAGLQLQSSSDRLKGINIISNNVKNTTLQFLPSVLDSEGIRLINAITTQSQVDGRTIQQQESFLNGPRTQFLTRVKEQLTKKYGADQADSTLLDTAANNILNAILQAEKQPGGDLNNKVANYMATQWRDAALDKLTHSFELTSLGVGVGAFIDPTNLTGPLTVGLSLSAWLSKYDRGAGAVNSVESYDRLRQADEYGIDNLDLKMDAATFVEYLNGMMDVSRGMPEYKDGKIVRNFPEIKLSDDKNFIVIPAALYNYDKNLILNIADGAQVSYDNDQNILISRTEDMRMVALGDQNKAVYKLNVGSAVTDGKDYAMKRFSIDFDKKNSNDENIFVSPDKLKHRTTSKLEINEASRVVVNDVLKPDAGTQVRIEGDQLIYTKNGKVERVSINGGTVDGWTLSQTATGFQFKKLDASGKSDTKEANLDYVFEGFESAMKHIDSQAKQIEKWENSKIGNQKVKKFYEYAIANNDTQAAQQLLGMDSTIDALINNGSDEERSQLVSYMTEAFALEEVAYKKMNAVSLMKARDKGSNTPAYARIDRANSGGISINSLFSRTELASIYASVGETPSNGREPQKDLIGYTAFYRRNANNKARGYAMTLPGYTRILGGKINTFNDTTKEANAKTWLTENIKTDSLAQKAVKASLATKMKGIISETSINNLTPDQLVTLLKDKGSLMIDGCTLSLEATPVFYLLAECANESLGLQIKAITCKDQNGNIIKDITTDMTQEYLDGNYTENVNNAGPATRTLGKRTIFKVAVGAATTFNGNNNGGIREGSVDTNPGHGNGDGTGGTGTSGPGGGNNDGTSNGTGGG